jgi:hypothetical protein
MHTAMHSHGRVHAPRSGSCGSHGTVNTARLDSGARRRRAAVVVAVAGPDGDGNPWEWGLGGPSGDSRQQRVNQPSNPRDDGGQSYGHGGRGGGRGRGRQHQQLPRRQQQQQGEGPDFESVVSPPGRQQQWQQRGGKGRGGGRGGRDGGGPGRLSSQAGGGGSSGGAARERVRLFQGEGAGGGADEAANAAARAAQSTASLLTRQIMACRDWPALEAALEDKAPALNAVHVSAALHQLSRVVGSKGAAALPAPQRRRVALLVEALLARGEEVADAMGGQEISCCVGALARLGLPQPRAAPALVALSAGRLGRFRNKELLHLGWAAARLGYLPPQEWLEEFQDETYAR